MYLSVEWAGEIVTHEIFVWKAFAAAAETYFYSTVVRVFTLLYLHPLLGNLVATPTSISPPVAPSSPTPTPSSAFPPVP